jgi:hypothetical protein
MAEQKTLAKEPKETNFESIEFVNPNDFTNLEDEEYDDDDDSDDSGSEYYESESEAEYYKKLKKIQAVEESRAIEHFLNICLSTKQIWTISSTRSFSSPLNLTTMFFGGEKSCQIDKNWSLRSTRPLPLAIDTTLAARCKSIELSKKNQLVADHDSHRVPQRQCVRPERERPRLRDRNSALSHTESNSAQHKSKSLKLKHDKLEAKKKFSTAIGSEMANKMKSMDVIKQKSATLSRKQVNQIMNNKQQLELQRFSTKYKH